DWCVGALTTLLENEGLLENTLIIFTSDNGPVINDGYKDEAVEKLGDHKPWGPLRGGKYSLYEAGTRVPFIAYWPGTIKPGVSEALICQIDLLASLAELTGTDVKAGDSEELLDVLLGISDNGRTALILEASSRTALRYGDWVMIPPYNGPAINKQVNIELGNASGYQLYNLKTDLGQQENLAEREPEKLEELIAEFKRIRGTDADKHVKPLILQ